MKTKFSLAMILFAAACSDSDVGNPTDSDDPAPELITAVTLTFTADGGSPLTFEWSDPEADGSPVIDPIALAHVGDYDCSVAFRNDQSNPPEDITAEVRDESDQHQVFFTGAGVEGPATGDNPAALIGHAYADTDVNGY